MGEVFRAVRSGQKRPVAIKILKPVPPHCIAGSGASLVRESQLMASLAHPNVVAVYECGETAGRAYLVIEYVEGTTLRSLLTPGQPLPLRQAAVLLDTVARALTYIHGRGILHLDLKPENVLCGQDGVVKLSDFGLALPQVDARTLSELGLAQGTLDYCAPEQRYGLPIDERADLFALAILAYELLTGRLPGRVYVPATSRNPALPAGLDRVLQRGLARDPDERYATVEEFRQDLTGAHGVLPSS